MMIGQDVTVFASYEKANAVAFHLNTNDANEDWTYTISVRASDGKALINVYDEEGYFVGLL